MKIGVIIFNEGHPHEDGEYIVMEGYGDSVHFGTCQYTVKGGWNTHIDYTTGEVANPKTDADRAEWNEYIRLWAPMLNMGGLQDVPT